MKHFQVVTLLIPSGTYSKQFPEAIDSGQIQSVVAFFGALNNPGVVRLSITDASKNEVTKLLNIQAFRSREVQSELDGLKLDIPGGKTYIISVVAEEAFTDDTIIDFVYNFKQENC